jgi:hypothetical protein
VKPSLLTVAIPQDNGTSVAVPGCVENDRTNYGSTINQNWALWHGEWRCWFGERLGSGDGERKTLLTRQIAFEPLPASVLFGFLLLVVWLHGSNESKCSAPNQSSSVSG